MPPALLTILVGLILCATLLPLSRSSWWWVRDLEFPRLQIALLALGVLVAQFWYRDTYQGLHRLLIAVDVACLLYQAWWILPYTRIYPREVKTSATHDASNRIRIMTSNVLQSNHNAAGLLDLVRQHHPDILVTLESNAWWEAQLDSLSEDYPHTLKCPLENRYGMHVYSRLPLRDSSIEFLVDEDIPSMHATAVLPSGQAVRIHFVHPTPPSPTENDKSAERDAELLLVAKRVVEHDRPVIVTGDLNDVAWSATTRLFQKISGLLDPRIGRGMFNTFHTGYWFMRWPLDHLFHSEHFSVSLIRRLPAYGSDHFPMLVELAFDKPGGEHGLAVHEQDRQEAKEKIREGIARAAETGRQP